MTDIPLFLLALDLAFATLSLPVALTLHTQAHHLVVLALLALPTAGVLAISHGWTPREFWGTAGLWIGGFALGCVVVGMGNAAALAPVGPLEGALLGAARGAMGGAIWLLPRVALAGP